MPALETIANVGKNLQELDLRPIREAAEQPVRVAIVGRPGTGKAALARQMLTDRTQEQFPAHIPILVTTLEAADQAREADLIILLLAVPGQDDEDERAAARQWTAAGKKVLALRHETAPTDGNDLVPEWVGWAPARVIAGSVDERSFLEGPFTTTILEMLPEARLALARSFPLFRVTVAQELINETCIANATYSLGTGLAEIVPLLDLPLTVTDILVLTKGQALLVYKLGLALGLATDWHYYIGEFGGVIGGGLLWRQLARSLIGLVPGLGILPKVAIAYAGTYVVGEVVLQWYLTGRHVSGKEMQDLYQHALQRGKVLAMDLVSKLPRPHTSGDVIRIHIGWPRLPGRASSHEQPLPEASPLCQNCGVQNDPDASFCKHCGQPLALQE
jgi:hypothetical protein